MPGNAKMATPPTDSSIGIDRSLAFIFCITMASVMGTTSITPAFPDFRRHFGISEDQVALLISFYTVPGILLSPFTGWMADKYGRKEVLLPSLLLFGIAGGCCFFASSFAILLLLRFLQGMGAASLGALNTALIGDRYSGRKRITVMGYNSSVLSIATGVYPAVGGGLALLGWNFPFLLPLIAIPLAIMTGRYLKDRYSPSTGSKNYWGRLWKSTNRKLALIFLSVSVVFILFFGAYLSYFPFLLSDKFKFGSGTIGLIMATMSVSTAFTSFQTGRISRKFSLPKLLQNAFLLYAVALLLIALANSVFLVVIASMILGLAQGLCMPAAVSLIAIYAPGEMRGMYMSLNVMSIRAGQTIGPLLMGWFFLQFRLENLFFIATGIALVFFLVHLAFSGKIFGS